VSSFINSVHLVYYVSTIFLLLALIPSLTRGRHPGAITEVEVPSEKEGA
jgi:hypothetical protein